MTDLKSRYLEAAIAEYEYSRAPEYAKQKLSPRALLQGTLDLDHSGAETGVEIGVDGAWVTARVWVPKEWVDPE